jgi:GH24 family phage-related lysozyme (muramidase)
MPILRRGDEGEAVKELQRGLNRVGSMLTIDGDFGPTTEAAVVDARAVLKLAPDRHADDDLVARLLALPEPSAELTAAGVTFIGREEVSSPAAYRKRYLRPVWPTPASGITIGIGYDLKFADRAKLEEDWGEILPSGTLDRLAAVSGAAGSEARRKAVEDIEIPLPAAMKAFLSRMMPEHIGNTRRAYPSLDGLPAHRRTALISLVFNRGAKLEGDRRREMKAIRDLLAAGRADEVAAQISAMRRLWDPATEPGVIARRNREATLWRDGFGALQLA